MTLKLLNKDYRMSADYGTRNPSYPTHSGIDYTNNDTNSQVLSMGYGRVYKIVNDVLDSQHGMTEGKDFPMGRWGGNFIEVDMGDELYTRFKHLKQNSMFVKVGDYVVPGQPIAIMGNTGQSTGMHLHVQVAPGTDYGSHIDPLPYINEEKHFVGIKAPTPVPTPSKDIKVGDKVKILSTGDNNENGNGGIAGTSKLGQVLDVMGVSQGKAYPYKCGRNTVPTGWFKKDALELVESANAPVTNQNEVIYIVQPNDNLTKIGRLFNVTVNQLVAWNNIPNPNHIDMGQKLTIKK